MADSPRIDDLRRRVQKDPASIAFAQLGEEYRRAGQFQEAADVCRAGLAIHPGYLSAHVTLGRALIELHDFLGARSEFETVLKSAPENLAALRGLAEVLHKSGLLSEALTRYRAALDLARNDPDLERAVEDLTRELTSRSAAPGVAATIPFEPQAAPPVEDVATAEEPVAADSVPVEPEAAAAAEPLAAVPVVTESASSEHEAAAIMAVPATSAAATEVLQPVPHAIAVEPAAEAPGQAAANPQVKETIEALEQWLDAIHVSRASRSS